MTTATKNLRGDQILERQHRRARMAAALKKIVCIALIIVTLIPFYISVISSNL